ncbi:MAG: site-specific integrase, partial [Nocardioidaceae bacterium]|nr:site-specific integrase [Nocardioidaceae bacterium]
DWAAARPVRESTERQDRSYLTHLDSTALGGLPITRVRPTDVQAFVADRARVLAPTTVANVYGWVKAVFADAVENRRIVATPCTSKIRVPKRVRTDIVPLTVAQVHALAEAAPPRYAVGVVLQAACGLRISELLAVQVRDVDFLRRTVRVERQLARDGRRFVTPKTHHSTRTIPLARDVVPLLAAHVAANPPNVDGVILTTTAHNPVRQDLYSERVIRPAVAAAGLPADTTSHDLRHHFASVLLRQGVPANVVGRYMGHSTAALVLDTYGHLMPDSDQVTRQALDALWSPDVSSDVSHEGIHPL